MQCIGSTSNKCGIQYHQNTDFIDILFFAGSLESTNSCKLGAMEAFLRGWWGKNQGFILISDLHFSIVTSCGGELNQSDWLYVGKKGMDGTDGTEGAEDTKGVEGAEGMTFI